MMISRAWFAVALLACSRPGVSDTPRGPDKRAPQQEVPPLIDDLEHRTFTWFWDGGNPANGLVPDAFPTTQAFASIAAVGFGLTAYGVGVERGYITRAQAIERTLATLRFFAGAPQGNGDG